MRERLVMQMVTRPGPYDPPFDEDNEGFFEDWWLETVARNDVEGTRHLSFTHGRIEVVRATVNLDANFADVFEGFDPSAQTLEIELIETNADCRRQGHGRAAVDLIRERWKESQVVAVSLDADDFWRATGFAGTRRTDGAIAAHLLFVAPPNAAHEPPEDEGVTARRQPPTISPPSRRPLDQATARGDPRPRA